MNWVRNCDGFTINSSSLIGRMEPLPLRFSMVLRLGNTFVTEPSPSVVSVKLYDIDSFPTDIFSDVSDVAYFPIGIE